MEWQRWLSFRKLTRGPHNTLLPQPWGLEAQLPGRRGRERAGKGRGGRWGSDGEAGSCHRHQALGSNGGKPCRQR